MHNRSLITAAAASLGLALMATPTLAWDLHDTLAPGPTPLSSDAPPMNRYQTVPDGADLRLPDVGLGMPNASGRAPVHSNACTNAIAQHGENSAEAWTQC